MDDSGLDGGGGGGAPEEGAEDEDWTAEEELPAKLTSLVDAHIATARAELPLPGPHTAVNAACAAAAALAAGLELADIARGLAATVVPEMRGQVARIGDGQLHVSADVELCVELGLLRQVADAGALGCPSFADEVGVQPGHDPEQRALAGPVRPDDADLSRGIEGQADVLEDLPLGRNDLREAMHVVDELRS